jgi:preprotein translocase subunit SecG
MQSVLLGAILISWILFIGSVMLMSPKWGLWIWLGGMSWWGEYWSKKSLETTLKKVAVVTAIIFVAASLFYPFM